MSGHYDIVIIGAGVVGCAIARELSKYKLTVAVLEAENDVSMGASRANSGIVHSGYDAKPGTAMARLNVMGCAMYGKMCDELGVAYKRTGSMTVAWDERGERMLQELLGQGVANGVPDIAILSGDEARELEPLLSKDVTAALYAPSCGITNPFQLTIALYENASENGAEFFFNAAVKKISKSGDVFEISAGDTQYHSKYIINAAGIHADEIARLAGDDSFSIVPRVGEYILMDKDALLVTRPLFQTPSAMGKGVLVAPTVDNNIYIGPTARDTTDKGVYETTAEGFLKLRELARMTVEAIDTRKQITGFAGLRAVSGEDDFIIRDFGGMIHAAGICSPGLTSAPAIAQEVRDILSGMTELIEKEEWTAKRIPIPKFESMSDDERSRLIYENPAFGHVVCRCETVTEGEIVEAIRRGARTLDGIKRRVRTGMGRCQGGFCAPRIMEIIARETGLAMTEILKDGEGSNMVVAPTR
ncbi:MAG: NAD(P)/FAD-dependent oxidoreductase [Oscillospiraceae bacterium]|nr:NAD(P)/FAD-dependent oxidoreductase [Oscillospiraceae bacterium]